MKMNDAAAADLFKGDSQAKPGKESAEDLFLDEGGGKK
jgi:hypothetical protein